MENIIENNKLIAEFMGYETMDRTNEGWQLSTFNFHNSWDSLMPVIFKIVDNKNIYAQERQVILNSKCSDISIAHNKVVEVINRLKQNVK